MASDARGRHRPVFFPRGAAAPDVRTGFVADGDGRIEALALSTGEMLWQTLDDARPLIVVDHRLATLKKGSAPNVLLVDVIDTSARGRVLLESQPIEFPEWAVASVEGDESFHYSVVSEGTDLLLHWSAQARYRGGAAPPQHVRALYSSTAAGIAKLQLDTGEVTMLPPDETPEIAIPDAVQSSIAFSYRQGATAIWRTEPWHVNGALAVISGEFDGERQTLHLQRWDAASGTLEPPCSLLTGVALVCAVTGDGRYLLIHSEHEIAGPNTPARSPWWIFDVTACARIAVHAYETGTREPSIIGSRLYFVVDTPLSVESGDGTVVNSVLRSIDLSSGALVWQKPLAARAARPRPQLRQ